MNHGTLLKHYHLPNAPVVLIGIPVSSAIGETNITESVSKYNTLSPKGYNASSYNFMREYPVINAAMYTLDALCPVYSSLVVMAASATLLLTMFKDTLF